ncbi:hypothetical protein ABLO16_17125, partial [Mycobacterium tuberculosis]
ALVAGSRSFGVAEIKKESKIISRIVLNTFGVSCAASLYAGATADPMLACVDWPMTPPLVEPYSRAYGVADP